MVSKNSNMRRSQLRLDIDKTKGKVKERLMVLYGKLLQCNEKLAGIYSNDPKRKRKIQDVEKVRQPIIIEIRALLKDGIIKEKKKGGSKRRGTSNGNQKAELKQLDLGTLL